MDFLNRLDDRDQRDAPSADEHEVFTTLDGITIEVERVDDFVEDGLRWLGFNVTIHPPAGYDWEDINILHGHNEIAVELDAAHEIEPDEGRW